MLFAPVQCYEESVVHMAPTFHMKVPPISALVRVTSQPSLTRDNWNI